MKNEIMCCDSFPELVLIDFACVYYLHIHNTHYIHCSLMQKLIFIMIFLKLFWRAWGLLPGELILGGGGG